MEEKQNPIKKFWKFLNEDTWQSWTISLLLMIIIIKFVFFPLLSFITGSPLPLVVVESCSMYHQGNLDDWWFKYSTQYEKFKIEKEQFEKFPLKNGLTKGDIIFVWNRSKPKIGDIIIFNPNSELAKYPIIHRIVTENPTGTKGDNGRTNSAQLNGNNQEKIDETEISDEQIIGKSIFKIPAVGWIKLVFFEFARPKGQRGFCY